MRYFLCQCISNNNYRFFFKDNNKMCKKRLTADVMVPNIGSGILPAFLRIKSSEPPSMYSMHILISPSLRKNCILLILSLSFDLFKVYTCKTPRKIQQCEKSYTRAALLVPLLFVS